MDDQDDFVDSHKFNLQHDKVSFNFENVDPDAIDDYHRSLKFDDISITGGLFSFCGNPEEILSAECRAGKIGGINADDIPPIDGIITSHDSDINPPSDAAIFTGIDDDCRILDISLDVADVGFRQTDQGAGVATVVAGTGINAVAAYAEASLRFHEAHMNFKSEADEVINGDIVELDHVVEMENNHIVAATEEQGMPESISGEVVVAMGRGVAGVNDSDDELNDIIESDIQLNGGGSQDPEIELDPMKGIMVDETSDNVEVKGISAKIRCGGIGGDEVKSLKFESSNIMETYFSEMDEEAEVSLVVEDAGISRTEIEIESEGIKPEFKEIYTTEAEVKDIDNKSVGSDVDSHLNLSIESRATVEKRAMEDVSEAVVDDMVFPSMGMDGVETENDAVEQEADLTEADGETMEGDTREVDSNSWGKRKRARNANTHTKTLSRKRVEEDVCFICFDGGDLVLCDRRACPKAYHPSCVNRDEAFFRAKGRWNCGWHLCSICEKNAYYMCYTCTFSLCKNCTKDAVILSVRGNKGFCEVCMKTVLLIEGFSQGDKTTDQIDFDDRSSWEYLFKDYWTGLKKSLGLTASELEQAKNPWKGPDVPVSKLESAQDLYDPSNSDSGSISQSGELIKPKRKARRQAKSVASNEFESVSAEDISPVKSNTGSTEWASKELMEFVIHMKNGDGSVLSQFDVQGLLLDYIKINKLRDPRRKSQIICDERLENLFGKTRVGHFEMLKLIESHFILREDTQVDILHGSVDNDTRHSEGGGNVDLKSGREKKVKPRKKHDDRESQSNLDDYAAISMHNINLIYLRRNLMEELVEDGDFFNDKVVGSFVRLRISGNLQKQDTYRLVQVAGTSKAAAPYRVGKKTTNFLLEVLNLNKTEVITIDIISNQDFTEDECKRLRQSIKCGLLSRLTVGDVLGKAMALHSFRVNDWIESEIVRLNHLRDRASETGRRKDLRECIEKLQILKTGEERQRRLDEIPVVHADPNMAKNQESEEEDDQKKELLRRPSFSSRRGKDNQISPKMKDSSPNEPWSGGGAARRNPNWDFGKSHFHISPSEIGKDEQWNRAHTSDPASGLKTHSTSEPSSRAHSLPPAISSIPRVPETEKAWHYRDPSGKVQGPFSMTQLRKWSNTGYFPTGLRIWRSSDGQDDSWLLTDVLPLYLPPTAPPPATPQTDPKPPENDPEPSPKLLKPASVPSPRPPQPEIHTLPPAPPEPAPPVEDPCHLRPTREGTSMEAAPVPMAVQPSVVYGQWVPQPGPTPPTQFQVASFPPQAVQTMLPPPPPPPLPPPQGVQWEGVRQVGWVGPTTPASGTVGWGGATQVVNPNMVWGGQNTAMSWGTAAGFRAMVPGWGVPASGGVGPTGWSVNGSQGWVPPLPNGEMAQGNWNRGYGEPVAGPGVHVLPGGAVRGIQQQQYQQQQQQQQRVCKFHGNGGCRHGPSCNYMHPS